MIMQSQTSDNSGFNKLKTLLFLILTCNQTALLGCIFVWVFIQQRQLFNHWFDAVTFTFCLLPLFLGEAVNTYVLGRIRLDSLNNWNDVKITDQTKDRIAKYHNIYRAFSFISAFGLAALNIFLLAKYPVPDWGKYTIIAIVLTHFSLCTHTICKGIIPILPYYKKGLLHRFIIISITLGFWYIMYRNQDFNNISMLFVFISSLSYFFISGLMHPLPMNGSLIGSVLKEILATQNNTEKDLTIAYDQKHEDIEDASIVEGNINEVSRETVSDNFNTEEVISPDAIILSDKETPDEQL